MSTNPTLGYLETAIDFDERSFRLGEDCVGAKLHFEYSNAHYVICFPNFDFAKVDGFGHPKATADRTTIRLNWIAGRSADDNYGSEYNRNPQNKTVLKFSANKLIIQSRGPVTSAVARKAKKDLVVWRQLFADWTEALKYTDLTFGGVTVQQEDNLQIYFVPKLKPTTSRRLKTRQGAIIMTNIMLRETMSKKDVRAALRLAATKIGPPGYYQQIISSLRYFNEGKYRQCVLDAATAFEMAMTSMLDARLSKHTPAEKKMIEDKYKQIVGLSDGLRRLGVNMPTQADIQTKIAEPRNSAIHRGKVISKVEAQEALAFAKDFIYGRLPIKLI